MGVSRNVVNYKMRYVTKFTARRGDNFRRTLSQGKAGTRPTPSPYRSKRCPISFSRCGHRPIHRKAPTRSMSAWMVWKDVKLPDGKILIFGIATHSTNVVQHPELVAWREGCLIDLLPEGSMPDRNKPRGTVIVRGRPSSSTQDAAMPFEKAQRKRSRTESELQSIVIRVSQNAALMQRFRSTFGSENRDLAREVSQEITRYAQELDSTVTFDEGTTIVLALLKMAGLSSDR
jgi:hypothetical protein